MTITNQRVASIDDVAEVVAEAASTRTRLRIVGRGTWLDAGREVSSDALLDLSSLSGIVDYVPGDFTLTAHAGTTLEEIDDATRAHGQYLPLDPMGVRSGSLGATLATGSIGPLAATNGTPRDITLGVTFVDGSGTIIQGGGRVVKNVAGFDLVRMSIGAWGTLGVIGAATVRLRAIAPVDCTMAVDLPPDAAGIAAILDAAAGDELQPLASEILNPALAQSCGIGASTLLTRLAGNVTGVQHRRERIAGAVTAQDVRSEVWGHVAQAEPRGSSVIRLSVPSSQLARLWVDLTARLGTVDVFMLGSVRRGVVRVCVPREVEERLLSIITHPPAGATVIVERLSPMAWPEPSARLTHRLATTLRQTFDPHGILNPGLLAPASA